MALTPKSGDLTAGVANAYVETINAGPEPLVTGDSPALAATTETVLTGQTLAALTVVGFDAAGKLVPADPGAATPVPAIGVLVYDCDSTGGDVEAEVYRQGVFNPNVLVWGAYYSTDALKQKAFEGAPSPTAIIIRKPNPASV